jgi:hypothetical protein
VAFPLLTRTPGLIEILRWWAQATLDVLTGVARLITG